MISSPAKEKVYMLEKATQGILPTFSVIALSIWSVSHCPLTNSICQRSEMVYQSQQDRVYTHVYA